MPICRKLSEVKPKWQQNEFEFNSRRSRSNIIWNPWNPTETQWFHPPNPQISNRHELIDVHIENMYIYIYIYLRINIDLSEVVGKSTWEIGSLHFVRACVSAVWLPSGIRSQTLLPTLSVSLLLRWTFRFAFLPSPHPQTSYPILVWLIGRYMYI